jgi:type I restriction enzyme S subunit
MTVEKLITQHIDTWTSALQTRSTAGRGSNGKIDLYGIKKLRELILELAVRGKLVPQDPNDEPASELLKRIAAEKADLVKQGKIKKQKPLPEISEEEKPFELPKGWEWVRLGFITNYGECDKAEPRDANENTWIVELEDIEKNTSKLLNRITFSERPFKSSKNKFNKGDVLYGKLRPYLDKVLVADDDGVCTTEIIPVKAYGNIISD